MTASAAAATVATIAHTRKPIAADDRLSIAAACLSITVCGATMRAHAIEPLAATQTAEKYDVAILVDGGGINGQAGAIRLAIARALLKATIELKPTLRGKGMLTRDGRAKERKKYGQPGARKRFQFSKR